MPKSKAADLSRKRERLEALAVISIHFDEETKTAVLNGDAKAAILLVTAVDAWIQFSLRRIIVKCCDTLCDSGAWPRLAENIKKFNSELNLYLTGLKTSLRLLYNMPDHRPASRLTKGARIAALKDKHPKHSFGKLALRYLHDHGEQITAGDAERSLSRYRLKQQKHAKRQLELAEQFRVASGLSEAELSEKLPTPEYVLEILTHD